MGERDQGKRLPHWGWGEARVYDNNVHTHDKGNDRVQRGYPLFPSIETMTGCIYVLNQLHASTLMKFTLPSRSVQTVSRHRKADSISVTIINELK